MLSNERLEFVKGIVESGVFVKTSVSIWKGNISFVCHEDDVNYGMGERILPASRYKITCTRPLKASHFNISKFISKSFNATKREFSYRTKYGLFIHNSNIDGFFERVDRIRSDMDSLVDRIVSERGSIIEDLRKQYSEVAIDTWRRRYGDGKPPANYVENMVSRYVDRFPSETTIRKKFRMEIFPATPVITEDMPLYRHIDHGRHNMKVYRELYDEIIDRRKTLYHVAVKLIGFIESKEDSGKNLAGAYKRIFLKMRGYMTMMFYDEGLLAVLNRLCDTLSVSDGGRSKDGVVSMLVEIADMIKTDKMLVVYV